jgi:hypothetical protein
LVFCTSGSSSDLGEPWEPWEPWDLGEWDNIEMWDLDKAAGDKEAAGDKGDLGDACLAKNR